MAATAAIVDLRFLCPKSPKWNPLTLLSLPMPSDLRMVAGAAAGSSSNAPRRTWRRGQEEEHELLCCCVALRARVGLVPLWTEATDAGPSSLDAHVHTQTAH